MIRVDDVNPVIGSEDLEIRHQPDWGASTRDQIAQLRAKLEAYELRVQQLEQRIEALEQRTWWRMFKDWSKPWLSRLIRFGK